MTSAGHTVRQVLAVTDPGRPDVMGVYDVCMARLNVYVPDELAEAARAAELNVSAITQEAIRTALDISSVGRWLGSLEDLGPTTIDHAAAATALTDARDELWGDG